MHHKNETNTAQTVGRIPGEPGIWVVIFGDMIIFGLMFLTFMYYRREDRALFQLSQIHLNQTYGLMNTLFMLSSSLFVALSMQAARAERQRRASIGFCLALVCGLGFSVVKIFEYREKAQAGIAIDTNDFYTFYFVFTGIHFLHVWIGIVVLAFMARSAWSGRVTHTTVTHLESGASFWHLVDLLWIALFALLYLLR